MALIRPEQSESQSKPDSQPLAESADDNKDDAVRPTERKVVIEGPLSAIYTKALNAIYANKTSKAKVMLFDVGNEADKKLFIADDDSLASVANDLTRRAVANESFDVILLPSKHISPIRDAMETILRVNNINVYRSVEQWSGAQ